MAEVDGDRDNSARMRDDDQEDTEGGGEELELDFHIQFPQAEYDSSVVGSSGKGEAYGKLSKGVERIWPMGGEVDNHNQSEKSEKDVVMVLLGWSGSTHKNLAKYSDIYLKRGCIVLRYIAPVSAVFIHTSKMPVLANRLVRLLQDLQLDSHPIFFHVFSNGGSFTYSCLLHELYKIHRMRNTMALDIRGTIFDSSPAPRNLGTGFLAVKSIFGHLGSFSYVAALLAMVVVALQIMWLHIKAGLEVCIWGEQLHSLDPVKYHMHEIPSRNWLARLGKMRNHNYLFLYSDNDDLIPWTQVEEFADITAHATQSNWVVKKKFLGSLHVQHYRQYPEEYIEAVTDFIRHTIKTKKSPTVLWEGV